MNNIPLKIGITGGIGSGKSLICQLFKLLNIPVYDADTRAKWLMMHNPLLVSKIKKLFGEESYDEAGNINRKYISEVAFRDKPKLEALNQAVHPKVNEDFLNWAQKHQNEKFILKEAALLFETGSFKTLDKTITVFAPEELRISRVLKRDPFRTQQVVHDIIQKQMPENEKLAKADFIIYNDEQQMVIPQVLKIYQQILDLV